MKYKNLDSLIMTSRRSREYFFTLPTDVQLELSLKGEMIHSNEDMHILARSAERARREELLFFTR